MDVAIIGSVGIPASYGGFETLVEQMVVHNHRRDLHYTVYCSKKAYDEFPSEYQGARLKYLPLNANGMQSIPYDILSLIRASRKHDAVLVLGVSGCAFLPVFRLFSRKPLIINIDGLEHRRDKWNKWVRRFLKFSERMAVKHADVVVTDNQGITDYVKKEYGLDSELIAYGGDHVFEDITGEEALRILGKYDLKPGEYSLALCRIEPENNVHTILEAFSNTPEKKLMFIGNWDKSDYGREMKERYSKFPNIRIQDAVYDLRILNAIRNNCELYLHGHSAGGTNPSLVEAMFFAKPIMAFDCIYNRETTEGKALYFKDADHLAEMINNDEIASGQVGTDMKEIAGRRYTWDIIARQYEDLFKPCK